MKNKNWQAITLIIGSICMFLISSCSTTKYVPEGSYLLNRTNIKVDGNVANENDLTQYLRQRPNFKVFGLFRIHLGIYNLSGKDTTKKINRKLKESGEPPVIYDPFLTFQSEKELQKYMKTKGYMQAEVSSLTETKKKKIEVNYHITPNQPYRIRNIENNFDTDPVIDSLLKSRGGYTQTKIKKGDLFDIDVLDDERERISTFLRRRGYYYFNKECLAFTADSSVGDHEVDLKIILKPYIITLPDGSEIESKHQQYKIRNINITTYNGSTTTETNVGKLDTLAYNKNIVIYSNGKPLLNPDVIEEGLRIMPHSMYSDFIVERTYSRFNSLGILRASSIRFNDLHNGENELDCDISLYSAKPQSFSIDIEGTNSDGDLGFAANLGYAHKNVFRGSEVLGVKAKYAQEAYSGIQEILHKYVLDLGGEVSLNFPRFIFPFLRKDFKRRIDASTEFKINYNYQIRPQTYERTTISTGMKYMWNYRRFYKYSLNLIDLNYINISTSETFDSIYKADKYSVLRESYSDHFIMNTGFSISYDNQAMQTKTNKTYYKVSIETAGNILYGINNISHRKKNDDGQYEVGGIPYSQYVKGEVDYAYNQMIDERNRIVYHVGIGIAFPYGNASVIPFEKRFFGGGANGVRGWSVRTLGPGEYTSENYNDFVKQTGDIKLLMNMEYRAKLFWKLEAAAFLDAGNVWTIEKYEAQPNGQFEFDKFYKQIALAYGLGLRLDFSYFLIRFDLGIKAYNPCRINDNWRFNGLTWKDDCALHFAIGYPF
ncbi:MAG: BamA/TamA family outer membrane protein [Paludibacteraceae bacterium]|nr:BamA/TamA family outer membrane protein [Paludibacteraceae bacterium]